MSTGEKTRPCNDLCRRYLNMNWLANPITPPAQPAPRDATRAYGGIVEGRRYYLPLGEGFGFIGRAFDSDVWLDWDLPCEACQFLTPFSVAPDGMILNDAGNPIGWHVADLWVLDGPDGASPHPNDRMPDLAG